MGRGAIPPLFLFLLAVIASGARDGWNLVDDALILCRYAANVAAGVGPVFNPGQAVEGHSSPLWVVLLAAGGTIGMDLPYLGRALGVLSGAALVLSAAAFFHRIFPALIAAVLACIIAADAGLAAWSLSGLETSGFTLLVFLAVAVLWKLAENEAEQSADPYGPWLLGGLAGLLALTRPEGFAVSAILLAAAAALPRQGRRRIGFLMKAGLPFIVTSLALTAWRLSYYHEPLPLTMIAKWIPRPDAFVEGLRQAAHFIWRRLPVVVAAAMTFRVLREDTTWRIPAVATAAVAGLFLAEVLLAGGDWMGRDRLPAPVTPLLALLAGFGLTAWSVSPRLIVTAGIAAMLGTWIAPDVIPEHGRAAKELGEWLAGRDGERPLLGVAAAGAVPFHSGFVTVDALGITDPSTARTEPPGLAAWKPGHMRYDLRRFLARDPDIIVWEFGTAWTGAQLRESGGELERRGDYRRELLTWAEFRRRYRLIKAPPAAERYYSVFERIDPK